MKESPKPQHSSLHTTTGEPTPYSQSSHQNNALVEVRSAGAMGKGLFAKNDIPRGTRILMERPLLALSTYAEEDLDLPAFCARLAQLHQDDIKAMDGLHCNKSLITVQAREKTRQWYRDQSIRDKDGCLLKGKRLQDVAKASVKRFAIFLTNRVQMGSKGSHGCGLFEMHSRINHSCIPNSHSAFNDTIKHLTVHTVRPIQAGEQITVSYIDGACRTKQQRKDMIQVWNFECSCPACTVPQLDALRERMHKLDQRLAAYTSPFVRLIRRTSPADVPIDVCEALNDAEELAQLLKQQRLEGMDLCNTYRDCSKFSLEKGSVQMAKDYAIKELEIERCIVGAETEHMRDDMAGAEYWLANLE